MTELTMRYEKKENEKKAVVILILIQIIIRS